MAKKDKRGSQTPQQPGVGRHDEQRQSGQRQEERGGQQRQEEHRQR